MLNLPEELYKIMFFWFNSNFDKFYFNFKNDLLINHFSEIEIETIVYFVSYQKNKNYALCYQTNSKKLNFNYLTNFNSVKTLEDFFNYFKERKLDCFEFELKLKNGICLKTWFGNDLLITAKNKFIKKRLKILLPDNLYQIIFKQNSNTIYQLHHKTILNCWKTNNIEDFLFENEDLFFNCNNV